MNLPKYISDATGRCVLKNELFDEEEICQMAEKIKETNRQKMAQLQQQATTRPSLPARPLAQQTGQTTMLDYFMNGTKGLQQQPQVTLQQQQSSLKPLEPDPNSLDYRSKKGEFGWHVFGTNDYIPYVYRNTSEKFCAVRMAELKLLNKFLPHLPQDIISCTCIRSYFISEAEMKLLNEINERYSGYSYGRDPFTGEDLVVRLSDAGQFYEFLELCYRKLVLKQSTARDRCGFIRIGGETGPVVPYTSKDNVKLIPLFFFEGEIQNLKRNSVRVDGWELAYLKFCCKVQGIRNELFSSEVCEVVSVENIRAQFPAGTPFEECWPTTAKTASVSTGPISTTSAPQNPMNPHTQAQPLNSFTRWPNSLVPSQLTNGATVSNTAVAVAATRTNPPNSVISSSIGNLLCNGDWRTAASAMGGNQVLTALNRTTSSHLVALPGAVGLLAGSPAGTTAIIGTGNNACNQAQPLPQAPALIPSSVGGSTQGATTTVTAAVRAAPPPYGQVKSILRNTNPVTSPGVLSLNFPGTTVAGKPLPQLVQMNGLKRTTSTNGPAPTVIPALAAVPVRTQSNQPKRVVEEVIDLSSPPSSPHPISPLAIPNSGTQCQLGPRVEVLPEISAAEEAKHPYQISQALIHNKLIKCVVNLQPSIFNDQVLMMVDDLVKEFFPHSSRDSVLRALEAMNVTIYKCNSAQMKLLQQKVDLRLKPGDIIPMVKVKAVNEFMPQLEYICSSSGTTVPAKRMRTE